MDLQNKRVLVAGTGISGIGAAGLLYRIGAVPVLYDGNKLVKTEEISAKIPDIPNTEIIIGSIPEERRSEFSLIVISPGVPADAPFAEEFKRLGIPVWGEIELAYRFTKGRIAAITGTNGKTTTTALIGEILTAHYKSVFVVGNIGNPFTEAALYTVDESVTVAEISSFQLETVYEFAPRVSAILNITPDHLDRHHTMEGYVKAKEAIAQRQTREETCVLNYENEYTRNFGERCPAHVVYFSSARALDEGLYLEGDEIILAEDGRITGLMNIRDMNLVGICNAENVMAAIAVCRAMEVPMDIILTVIKFFKAVEHRIEFVATRKGVDYYNDSKGTNPDAAIQGIRAMTKPTVLIGGGYDKQSEYDEWIKAFDGKVKALVLVGQTKDKIAACARKHGISNIILTETFEEAFEACTKQAAEGDAVLLSPACASWGMFPNYEIRGKLFKELVARIGV